MRALKKRIIVELPNGKYLLINPYSGLADIIDSETRDLLESERANTTHEVSNSLKLRGHLVEEGEEDDLFEYLRVYAHNLTYLHRENPLSLMTHILIHFSVLSPGLMNLLTGSFYTVENLFSKRTEKHYNTFLKQDMIWDIPFWF